MDKFAQIITFLLAATIPAIQSQTTGRNTIPRRGTVRLVRNGITSNTYSSGRVQIYINSRWGQICDDFQFSITEAAVICHQLGFSGASSFSRAAVDTFGTLSTTFQIVLDDVDCSSSTYLTILQCRYSTYIDSNCDRGVDDVSVICLSTRIWNSPYDLQIRLSRALYTNQGLVEVYCNGQWGTVCDDSFDQIDANTVCRQQGYTGAARYDRLTLLQGSRGQPIWLDNVFCRSSSYSCLRSCQRCPSRENHNCRHSEDVTVECEYRSGSSVSNRVSTCNFGTTTAGRTTVNVGGIVTGVIVGVIVCILLPIVIPICICICLGVGIGASCRKDVRRPRVVRMAAPPTTSATSVTTNTTSSFEKSAYHINPQTNPIFQASPYPTGSYEKSAYPDPQTNPYLQTGPGLPPNYTAATSYPVQPTQAPQYPPAPYNPDYPAPVPQSYGGPAYPPQGAPYPQ